MEPTSAGPVDIHTAKSSAEDILDPVRARKAEKLRRLAEHREAIEVSEHDLDLNLLFQLNNVNLPLTRREMNNEAVVVTREDLETLRGLDFIHVSGQRMKIEPEYLNPNDVLILYPWEVADVDRASYATATAEDTPAAVESPMHELRMYSALLEIFSDVIMHPPTEHNAEWDKIVTTVPFTAEAIKQGRAKQVPEVYIRQYAHREVSRHIGNGNYSIALRILRNVGFGTPEEQAEFEAIAAEVDPAVAAELQARLDRTEAIRRIDALFADVPPRSELAKQLPDFWESVPAIVDMPAGVIIDGRASGVPEIHLRRFAADIIATKLVKGTYDWIARFLKSMKLGTSDVIAFFEDLSTKGTK